MKSAFLIVDLQDGWAKANPLTTRDIQREAQTARKKKVPIVWTFIGLMPASTPAMSYGQLKTTEAYNAAVKRAKPDLRPAVTPNDNDLVIFKKGRDLFENPQAQHLFRDQLGVSNIGVAGYKASDCLKATSKSGAKLGFETRVRRELTADQNDNCFTSLPVLLKGSDVEIGEFAWN